MDMLIGMLMGIKRCQHIGKGMPRLWQGANKILAGGIQ